MSLLGAKNLDILFGGIDESTDNALGERDISELQRIVETIPGVTASQKYELSLSIMNHIIKKYEKSDEKLSKALIREEILKAFDEVVAPNQKEFESTLATLKAYQVKGIDIENLDKIISVFTERLQVFQSVKDNWDEITKKTAVLMYKYLGLSGNKAEQDFEAEAEQIKRIFSKESVENLVKDSIPTELRKFMAGILNMQDGQVVRGFMGVNTYVPFDSALNLVLTIIGKTPKANMTFEEMMQSLTDHTKGYPFLSDLVTKLERAPQDMKNRFMYHMTKHNLSMKYMMYEYDSNTRKYELRIFDTNSTNLETTVYNEWNAGLGVTDLINKNSDGDFTVDVNKAKDLLSQFKSFAVRLKDNNIELKYDLIKQFYSENNKLYDEIGNGIIPPTEYLNTFKMQTKLPKQ